MSITIETIGLGGGCHWCTEAVFQSLKGVTKVEQGYITSIAPFDTASEGVIVHFNSSIISLAVIIEIHLFTHRSASQHSMRGTYRSAIYGFEESDLTTVRELLINVSRSFESPIITQVLLFASFTASRDEITNYYLKDPEKPFCRRYIEPKLKMLWETYALRMVSN